MSALYICPDCGVLAPLSAIGEECSPGQLHGELIRATSVRVTGGMIDQARWQLSGYAVGRNDMRNALEAAMVSAGSWNPKRG